MIRVLIFLVVVFILGIGFAWLADRPGDLVITFGGYQYHVTLMVAALIFAALVASAMIAWWLLKAVWNSPRSLGRYFRARRRDRGYQALSTGLIAAGSGDSGLARKMLKQAGSQLSADQEPLLHLLDAQTLMLEGRHDSARARFEAMAEDPETRLLGLRGLYLEARRLGDHEAARHYAEEAAAAAPQLGWAANAVISARVIEDDFDGALKLIDGQSSSRQITRDEANDRRAVLLTAKAMALIDQDPAMARTAALEAHKLAPDFVPAAVIAGRTLFRHEEYRKGIRVLEGAWKKMPHPEIAEAYVHARPGDSTHDRLKRARRLEALKPNHFESAMAVARAALDAGELAGARQAVEAAIRIEPREGAYLLLADIEEAETGDQGRVRHWLSMAVRAPRDPAWTADGYVSESWSSVSPVTGAIGAFEWRVPVERLGSVIEGEQREFVADLDRPPSPQPDSELQTVIEADAGAAIAPQDESSPPPSEASPVAADRAAKREDKATVEAPLDMVAPARQPGSAQGDDESSAAMPRLPDDPGVEEEKEGPDAAPGRFRLF